MPDRTVGEAIREAAERLCATSDTARLDAEVLMAHALGCSRSAMLLARMRDPAPAGFAALVERRGKHEPVSYITGHQEFFGMPFMVGPEVLIPRGDSEVLVEAALAVPPRAGIETRRVLDCGTGSGALLLAVLANLPGATGVGIDSSPGARAVAAANARALGLADRARIAEADWHSPGWDEPLGGPFDLVLANPPYVETTVTLDRSVAAFEPASALYAGEEGLDDYRVLVPQLPRLLAPGGVALVEIGYRQAESVAAIGQEAGLSSRLHRDLGNRPRMLEFSTIA
ncbi:peptide chain release factor N(5)-glutamine methyltransferase [Sphingomonas sp. IC081]|uniref:peptide chain release factor N(5)-glutamine methyltransferase n=1 Tax=Sphingomonas sp. IC081 TaxID=304378 RepID=UPI001156E74D|nr:peptide chain release factor N(5)-glutamine methyltransferase [Sphingomonas sp. IC081]QDK34604.1 peptide chain release factor N(5)-glutamine methyltransferase [Sphingomonas sp. IC081]